MVGSLVVVLFLLLLHLVLTNGNTLAPFIAFVIVLQVVIALHNKPLVDLPEEHTQITSNKEHPDTLCGYRSGDSIYIQFTGKHR